MQRRTVFILTLVFAVLMLGARGVTAQDGGPQPVGAQAVQGSGFTYQGQLKSGGNPVNGVCDFQFAVFDALTGGAQSGSTQTVSNVAVSAGLFTVTLNGGGEFGGAFDGTQRYLQSDVRCPAGSGGYTTLSPRQPITAAPYALSLGPGAQISGTGNYMLRGTNTQTIGGGDGIQGISNSPGVSGVAGFNNSTTGGYGLYGSGYYGVSGGSTSPSGVGVRAVGGGATGTALQIQNGGIKVLGAGIGANTPVFIHRATAGNIINQSTYIDHLLTNGDPNAILIVTPNYNPGGVCGCILNNHAVGVIYDTGTAKWGIFNQDNVAMLVNAAFNVMVIKP